MERCHLFRSVILPIIEKYLFIISGSSGIVDDDPGIAVAQDAFARPVHARDDDLLMVKDEPFVVNVVLDFDLVEIYSRRLEGFQPTLQLLKLTQDDSHILASIDLGGHGVDQVREFGIGGIAAWAYVLELNI